MAQINYCARVKKYCNCLYLRLERVFVITQLFNYSFLSLYTINGKTLDTLFVTQS